MRLNSLVLEGARITAIKVIKEDTKTMKLFTDDFCNAYKTDVIVLRNNWSIIPVKTIATDTFNAVGFKSSDDTANIIFQSTNGKTTKKKYRYD